MTDVYKILKDIKMTISLRKIKCRTIKTHFTHSLDKAYSTIIKPNEDKFRHDSILSYFLHKDLQN